MRTLTVLYDARCEPCVRVRHWLERQPKSVPMIYIPAGSDEAKKLFPTIDHARSLVDLTVVGDDGAVWWGPKAWLVCLWALEGWREWAIALSQPGRIEQARSVIDWLSRNRGRIAPLSCILGSAQ